MLLLLQSGARVRCSVRCIAVINDLLIEQEVLKLQLQLLFLMMNRLFTCKIKEHNGIIVQIGLNRE